MTGFCPSFFYSSLKLLLLYARSDFVIRIQRELPGFLATFRVLMSFKQFFPGADRDL
jgi:hypothetical protein